MGKGGDFEREFSKKLSLWFTQGKSPDVFWHTHGSGGRATMRGKRVKGQLQSQHGDITAVEEEGKPLEAEWSIELKTGYSGKSKKKLKNEDGKSVKILLRWDLLDLIDSAQTEPVFYSFWNQARRDAELSGRVPVLVFRRNGRKPCIVFTRGYFNKLVDAFGFPWNDTVIQVGKRACIMGLDSFFDWVPDISSVLRKENVQKTKHSKLSIAR